MSYSTNYGRLLAALCDSPADQVAVASTLLGPELRRYYEPREILSAFLTESRPLTGPLLELLATNDEAARLVLESDAATPEFASSVALRSNSVSVLQLVCRLPFLGRLSAKAIERLALFNDVRVRSVFTDNSAAPADLVVESLLARNRRGEPILHRHTLHLPTRAFTDTQYAMLATSASPTVLAEMVSFSSVPEEASRRAFVNLVGVVSGFVNTDPATLAKSRREAELETFISALWTLANVVSQLVDVPPLLTSPTARPIHPGYSHDLISAWVKNADLVRPWLESHDPESIPLRFESKVFVLDETLDHLAKKARDGEFDSDFYGLVNQVTSHCRQNGPLGRAELEKLLDVLGSHRVREHTLEVLISPADLPAVAAQAGRVDFFPASLFSRKKVPAEVAAEFLSPSRFLAVYDPVPLLDGRDISPTAMVEMIRGFSGSFASLLDILDRS